MNIIKMTIKQDDNDVQHVSCTWANVIGNTVLCILSYSQDELVTSTISSAVYNHPSLKELTTGTECSPSLVNGVVGGIVRKAGMKKLVVKSVFPREL